MAITAKDVNALRQATGMGMMECKKALTDADGDVAKATELLRERAGGKMATRDAEAGEGAVAVAQDGNAIAIVKVMSETDFAARNDNFLAKTRQIAELALKLDHTGELTEPSAEIKSLIEDLRLTIKENISFGGGARLTGDKTASYVHTNNKSGAILTASGDADHDLMRGICMHITAAVPPLSPAPLAIDKDGLSDDQLADAKRTFTDEAQATGKPPEIADKIATGKMNKWVSDHTLLGQTYIREMDAKKPISDYVPSGATLTGFARVAVS